MLRRNKPLAFYVLAITVALSALAFSAAAQNEREGESTVRVATIFDAPVLLSDISPDTTTITQMQQQSPQHFTAILSQARLSALTEKIIDAVMLDYVKDKNLVIDSHLVEKFKQKFADDMQNNEGSKIDVDEVARKQVRQWQRDSVLYRDFGGTVIFTHSNPQMPVEAYKTLLRNYHNEGRFSINLSSFETSFWQVFEPPYRFEIAPENVDFSQPWWL